jgi:amino acid transporter
MRESASLYEILTTISVIVFALFVIFSLFWGNGNPRNILDCAVMIFFATSVYLSSRQTMKKLASLEASDSASAGIFADLRLSVAKLSMAAMMMGIMAWFFSDITHLR